MILNRITIKLSVLLLLVLSIALSCDKKIENELVGDKSSISFRVAGIIEPLELQATTIHLEKNYEDVESELVRIGEIGYTTSFGIDNKKSNNIKLNKLASTSTSNNAIDITYRFVLFQKISNDNYKYVGHKDAKSKGGLESLALEVYAGRTYKWVAYSYNNNDVITDVINGSSLSIQTAIDKDLLYDSGELTISEVGNNNIANIQFKHRLARIAITLDANEYPAYLQNIGDPTQSIDVTLNGQSVDYFKVGSLNLLTDEITGLIAQSYTGKLPYVVANSLDDGNMLTANFYTADLENSLGNISLRIKNMELREVYGLAEDVTPKILDRSLTISSKGITPARGYSYTASIQFKYPYEGVLKGNVIWARSNLTYDPVTEAISFKKNIFSANNSAVNDYWMFNSLTPWDPFKKNTLLDNGDRGDPIYDAATGIYANSGQQATRQWDITNDPCRQIPGGWRLPSYQESMNLGGQNVLSNLRKQASNWNNNNKKVQYQASTGNVVVPDGSYTFFKGDKGGWVAFYKSGIVNTTDKYISQFTGWEIEVPDSFVMPVSDQYGSTVGNEFFILQIDGEKAYFNDSGTSKHIDKYQKAPIRCVKTCDANCLTQFN